MRDRIVALLAVVLCCSGVAARADDFRGFIVDTGGAVPRRTSSHFLLHVDQYSTLQEVQSLADLLVSEGPQAVLQALRKVEKGYIKIGTNLGYPVGLVRSIDTDDGRIIRAVTDRPIQMFEVMRNTRSADYQFGMLEIQLPKEGKGSGKLVAAAQVTIKKDGAVEIEHVGTRPFTLQGVKLSQPKAKKAKD